MLLVHGWMATAALNWYGSLDFLGRSFYTVAPNLRGHGRLGRGAPPFSVEACADDLAELIAALALDRPIVVGYSMGGAVAQVLARRHGDLVGGIVLCATAASFARRLKLRPVVRVASRIGAAGSRRYPDAADGFLHWQIARHDRAVGTRDQSPARTVPQSTVPRAMVPQATTQPRAIPASPSTWSGRWQRGRSLTWQRS